MGSPGIALPTPSMACGVETLRSQNVASIAVRKLAIAGKEVVLVGVIGEGGFLVWFLI